MHFGVDLGARYNSIAGLSEYSAEVFKNNDGSEFTPTALWIDKKDRVHVGLRALKQLGRDPDNTVYTFKNLVGSGSEVLFPRSGRSMSAEELSAELLKTLMGDVLQRTGDVVNAATITVPLDYSDAQRQATIMAARLAGLNRPELVPEPIAAAMCVESDGVGKREHLLVLDLGASACHATLIQVGRDEFRVIQHLRDSVLSGEFMDRAIVEKLLVPELARRYKLTDFHSENPARMQAVTRLRLSAEASKVVAARGGYSEIVIQGLCTDETGAIVDLEFELTADHLRRLSKPLIRRMCDSCGEMLSRAGISQDRVDVMLIGGTSMLPDLRERVAESRRLLGTLLDYRTDPLTTVVRGAAIFAASTDRKEVVLGGRSRQSLHRSERPDTGLSNPPPPRNVQAAPRMPLPGTLPYQIGMRLGSSSARLLFKAGADLPLKRRVVLSTAVHVRKGAKTNVAKASLVMGKDSRFRSEKLIAHLVVPATAINGDLEAGSEIEITIEVNMDPFTLHVLIYLPALDQKLMGEFKIQESW